MVNGTEQPRRSATETTPYDPTRLQNLAEELVQAARSAGFPEASSFALRIAFEEAVANAYKHGHSGDASQPLTIEWRVDARRVRLSVEDQGPGFTPDAVPDPREDTRLELPSGRGLLMIRSFMSDVQYNEMGNRVEMVYEKPSDS